jgi:hypothetical protein
MVQFIELLFLIGIAAFGIVALFVLFLFGSLFFGAVFRKDSGEATTAISGTGIALMVVVMLLSHSVLLGGAVAGLTWFVLGTSRAIYREIKRPPAKREAQ